MTMRSRDTQILMEFAKDIIPMIADESEALHSATPLQIMNSEKTWELVDNQFTSVKNMSDQQLREAIIADICNVRYWRECGKTLILQPSDLHRHIDDVDMKHRILEQFNHPDVQKFISSCDKKGLDIIDEKYEDAQDFCGCYNSLPDA